ncbi:hypothetical protein EHQ75_15935 [Leptospira levettii]|uniref:hypothetical protein n=1 Tax=Leptospira levettii TaxID=2023178 RepID=UPI001082AEBD|nr:hypothetical protein [Leptospira levettii]TGM35678.1 hypothetical protein EHQ75_15935 [Leptospira levettii]
MGELITMFFGYAERELLPLWDPLFFFVVILGATFVLKIIEKNGISLTGKEKFWVVFTFATVASFVYILLGQYSGKLTDPQYALFRNFLNYVAAILFYHVIIKTSLKLFRFGMDWGRNILTRQLTKSSVKKTREDRND